MHVANAPVTDAAPAAQAAARPTAIIIGGGLAGIAAALRLARRGIRPVVLESSKRLGGRATSFTDAQSGRTLDNCQHVILGCCTALLDLYRELGVLDRITWHRTLYFAQAHPDAPPGGPVRGTLDVLDAEPLPAPLHMTRAMMGFKSLAWRDKLAITRAMAALMRMGTRGRAQWADRSFVDWLTEQRQPPRAIAHYWANVVISACNERPERCAANHAIQVFQEGFLANPDAYVMGVSSVPLLQLYDQAARQLEHAGGHVLYGASAVSLNFDGTAIRGVELADGRTFSADICIAAVPHDRLLKLCPDALIQAEPRLGGIAKLQYSPIVGIHLWYRREETGEAPLMALPHMVLLDSPLDWLFSKGHDAVVGGEHLHAVVSAAGHLVDLPADEIVEIACREIARFLPGGDDAVLVHHRVIKEKRATLSMRPGVDRLRPAATGNVANLYLAGDWTDTGWPATMEGAVRSGYHAADAALRSVGIPAGPTICDLPQGRLYQFLSGTHR